MKSVFLREFVGECARAFKIRKMGQGTEFFLDSHALRASRARFARENPRFLRFSRPSICPFGDLNLPCASLREKRNVFQFTLQKFSCQFTSTYRKCLAKFQFSIDFRDKFCSVSTMPHSIV